MRAAHLSLIGAVLTLLALVAAAQTVHRCSVAGRTVYQQIPCAEGSSSTVVNTQPNIVEAVRVPAASAPAGSSGAATPRTAGSLSGGGGDLEAETMLCLAYLRGLLRDPASARVVGNATKEGRVLSLKLQAANSRGRGVERDAACEVQGGKVDDGWTRIHLKRLGWFAPLLLPLPEDRAASRSRPPRAELDDIEKPGA